MRCLSVVTRTGSCGWLDARSWGATRHAPPKYEAGDNAEIGRDARMRPEEDALDAVTPISWVRLEGRLESNLEWKTWSGLALRQETIG